MKEWQKDRVSGFLLLDMSLLLGLEPFQKFGVGGGGGQKAF